MRTLLGLGVLVLANTLVEAPSTAEAKTYRVLYSFCAQQQCTDGYDPTSAPVRDSVGNFYGTTVLGGAFGGGTVYALQLRKKEWKHKVLHNFCSQTNCADGKGPAAPLILDTAGNLYGTTPSGGGHGAGEVFELSPNADHTKWKLRTLYSFCATSGCPDGVFSLAGLAYLGQSGGPYDGKAPLYGTTQSGGTKDQGTVFQLRPASQKQWQESVVYSFCSQGGDTCTDGARPVANVTLSNSAVLLAPLWKAGQIAVVWCFS